MRLSLSAGIDMGSRGAGPPIRTNQPQVVVKTASKEDWHLILVPLSEVAQFFWRHYSVNLLALSALQAVGGTSLSGTLARESIRTRAFAYSGRAEREERHIRDWHLSINVNIPK